eukprot:TRINITY_DN506_c0_g1_i3.p1 TRINITY_DN506_c0_g1~~TRINITY_DN506_c0_g1_i3.p1  ORF type:complete len:138 (+),score=9.79 TRINITY_DN506_c0_g1_i3:1-414(+)
MANNLAGLIKGTDHIKLGRCDPSAPDYRAAAVGLNFDVRCEKCQIDAIFKVGMNNEEEYTFSSIVPKCPQCKMELSLRDIKGTWLVQCKATITGQVMKSDGRFERKITELEAKEPLYISSAESGVQFTRTKFRMYPL